MLAPWQIIALVFLIPLAIFYAGRCIYLLRPAPVQTPIPVVPTPTPAQAPIQMPTPVVVPIQRALADVLADERRAALDRARARNSATYRQFSGRRDFS